MGDDRNLTMITDYLLELKNNLYRVTVVKRSDSNYIKSYYKGRIDLDARDPVYLLVIIDATLGLVSGKLTINNKMEEEIYSNLDIIVNVIKDIDIQISALNLINKYTDDRYLKYILVSLNV